MYTIMVEEPAQSDDSSSYSMTLSEFEEDRWYNPTSLSDDTAEIENIQRLIKYIRVTMMRILNRCCIIRFGLQFNVFTLGWQSNSHGNCTGRVGGLQSA